MSASSFSSYRRGLGTLGMVLALGVCACRAAISSPPTLTPLLPSPSLASTVTSTATALPPTETLAPSPRPSLTPSPTLTPIPRVYVFPVQPLKWVDYGPGHSGYPATDIFVPEGSRFLAVTGGVVDFVSPEDLWSPEVDDPATRGGRSVAILGDDGVRYYGSHLSQVAEGIAPGVRVEAGQLLGLTGHSGNARNTDPHVHFAISAPTFPEDWKTRRGQVDPYPYLQAWERGENLTPRLP